MKQENRLGHPDHTESDHSERNTGLHRQTIMIKQKREQSMTKNSWHHLLILDFVHLLMS